MTIPRRLEALEEHSQTKAVCDVVRKNLNGRMVAVEKHIDGLRMRLTGTLVAVVLALIGIVINLMLALNNANAGS